MEKEKKKFDRRFIIPVVMVVFYLGLFIWSRIAVPGDPSRDWKVLGVTSRLIFYFIPAFSVIISIISTIRFRQLLYSLSIALLNSFLCMALLHLVLTVFQLTSMIEGLWYILYSAFILCLGIAVSAIVLSIVFTIIFIKKIKRGKQL